MSTVNDHPVAKLREALDAVPDKGTVPIGVGAWLQPLINAALDVADHYRNREPACGMACPTCDGLGRVNEDS